MMEELICTKQDRIACFSATWTPWLDYRKSQSYQDLTRDNPWWIRDRLLYLSWGLHSTGEGSWWCSHPLSTSSAYSAPIICSIPLPLPQLHSIFPFSFFSFLLSPLFDHCLSCLSFFFSPFTFCFLISLFFFFFYFFFFSLLVLVFTRTLEVWTDIEVGHIL